MINFKEIVNEVPIMGLFRHFKGGYYLVHTVAQLEDTGEQVVVYQSVQNGSMWVRPLNVFQEVVPEDKDNPTGQTYRFERVNNFNNQLGLVPTDVLVKELNRRNDNPYALLAPQEIKVWREQYLTGMFEKHFIDEGNTVEDFNIDLVHDSYEGAVKRLEKLGNINMKILKQVFIEQDFDS